ncbi:MAG: hypothetical protein PVJ60_00625 [Phycisphaerales bacterium]|jgi:hypothetical protein
MIKTIDPNREYDVLVEGKDIEPFHARIKPATVGDFNRLQNARMQWLSGKDEFYDEIVELTKKYTTWLEGDLDIEATISNNGSQRMVYGQLVMLSVEITNLSYVGEAEQKN